MKRHFTLEEATRILPKVRTHLDSALMLQALVRGGLEELSESGVVVSPEILSESADSEVHELDFDLGDADVILVRARAAYQAMQDEVAAITKLGVVIKGVRSGLVDFPSFREGTEEVLLCWKRGESKIDHYHSLDDGFRGRKAIGMGKFSATRSGESPESSPESTQVSSPAS